MQGQYKKEEGEEVVGVSSERWDHIVAALQ